MKQLFVLGLLVASFCVFAQAAPEVQSDIYKADGVGMVLRNVFTTSASAEKIWQAIASTDGLAKWAAPAAHVELLMSSISGQSVPPGNAAWKETRSSVS